MNKQLAQSERYKESLKRTPGPRSLKDIPKIKMNLVGLSDYAKSKGVTVHELTQEEIDRFTHL